MARKVAPLVGLPWHWMCCSRKQAREELDLRLKALVRKARSAEAEVARALWEMKRRGLFRFLGYPRIQDYAEVELDMSGGKAKELCDLFSKLNRLPRIKEVFEGGELPWTKCRQIARVATEEDEEHWIHEGTVLSNRGLERKVAEAKGERPKVRIVLELSEEDAADLELAVRRLREERGEAVPIGIAVAELSRRAMGAPADRPGYQVVIHECPTCAAASRDSHAGPIEVSKSALEAAKVDAEILDLREGGKGAFRKTITPAERRAVIARDRGRCTLCGTRSWLHIHHRQRKDGDVGVLSLLCSGCHKGLVHAGHVAISGSGPSVGFRLSDGTALATRVTYVTHPCS